MPDIATRVGAIEPSPLGPVQVRIDRSIEMPDGTHELPSLRYVLSPGDSMAGQPAEVAAVCGAVWTQAVVTAWQARVAAIAAAEAATNGPRPLGKTEFLELLMAKGGMTVDQLVSARSDPMLSDFNLWLDAAGGVDLNDARGLTRPALDMMVRPEYMTGAQRDAVIAGWPAQ